MTSATEVLRRLLDERGVEYMEDHGYREFFWDFGESGRARASAIGTRGLVQMIVTGITPEQAIAATLGSCNCSNNCTNSERTETCYDTGESRIFHCSECGLGLDDVFIDDEEYYPFADFPRFCPFCGAKVVESTTNDVDAEVDS